MHQAPPPGSAAGQKVGLKKRNSMNVQITKHHRNSSTDI